MERERRATPADEAARSLGIGMTWVVSVVVFTGLGWWLDGRWGTDPLLTLAGALFGTVGGFLYMYHHAVVVPRERQLAERRARDEQAGGEDKP
jgi:F0F1-type ATP synthase assembly protein I